MNFSKITAHLKGYLKFLQYGDTVRPVRDWLVIVSIATLLVLAAAGWSYELFRTTTAPTESEGAAPSTSVSRTSLDTVRGIFEKRAEERAHYLTDYRFVDPSR